MLCVWHTVHVCVSGEDEHYRASELNTHGPTVLGWQSARECSYPQELILQLHSTATIQKIQVLAHQYLIRQYYWRSYSWIQQYYFIRQLASPFTQTILCDGWQASTCRHPNLLSVRVKAFQFNVLQSILHFYAPYVKQVVEIFPSTCKHASPLTTKFAECQNFIS